MRRTEGRATAGRGRGAGRLGRRGGCRSCCRSCSRSCRSLLVCTASRRGGGRGGRGGGRRRVVQRREACQWWAIRFARGFVDDHFSRHRCAFPMGCLPGGARDYAGAGVAQRKGWHRTAASSGGTLFPAKSTQSVISVTSSRNIRCRGRSARRWRHSEQHRPPTLVVLNAIHRTRGSTTTSAPSTTGELITNHSSLAHRLRHCSTGR